MIAPIHASGLLEAIWLTPCTGLFELLKHTTVCFFIVSLELIPPPLILISTLVSVLKDSGHGGQTPDKDGDEIDVSIPQSLIWSFDTHTSTDVQGMDEGKEPEVIDETCSYCASWTVIFPLDFQQKGHILDDVSNIG